MSQKNVTIICPRCDNEINVNDVLTEQVKHQLSQEYQSKFETEQKKVEQLTQQLAEEKKVIEKEKSQLKISIQSGVREQLKNEKEKMESDLKKRISEETQEEREIMEKELKEKTQQVKELYKTRAEIEKLKREQDELQSKAEAEAQKKLSEALAKERVKIQNSEQEKSDIRIKEIQIKFDEQKQLIEEMKRRQEEGSSRLKGEGQELIIEEWLEKEFHTDKIIEIKKGARGGDCIQIINTPTRKDCGSIYYESKRTKSFQPAWIDKFKKDMQEKNTNIGVLVTESMPSDMKRFGQRKGIWICNFQEFKGLVFVLRESIIQISNAKVSQENKGDKMNMLYDFLTSNEFKLQIEAIVDGFSQMQEDLEKEKRTFQGAWKRREKQIDKVILNTNFMYNSIKGIAGNAIQPVAQLDLPEGEPIDE